MSKPEDFGSYIKENKDLLKEYVETKTEVYRLQGIRLISKTGGTLIWAVLALFMLFLVLIFAGLVLGFWLSEIVRSTVYGFGLATLILMALTALLTIFRRRLFINPIIRAIINHSQETEMDETGE